MSPTEYALEVWGDFACFTRPELKVERFSYPCPTPSAARNIFDAIFLDRQSFRWQVTRIEILNAPRYIALRRNEVKEKIALTSVVTWMTGKSQPEPIWADLDKQFLNTDQKGRTQRQTIALRDVHYRLYARIERWPDAEKNGAALADCFSRRARQGKCFFQPYLGCREFPAYFELLGPDGGGKPAAPVDIEVGFMLYDVFDLSTPTDASARPAISLFDAKILRGVLRVPPYDSPEVLKPGGAA
jgi:CRISPR-associated protein Cas5d